MGTNNTEFPDQKAESPRSEAFVFGVVQRRIPLNETEELKTRWQKFHDFLTTSGGTALITVLIGGLFGQIISCNIQGNLKEREFQESWMKARGDQALVAYNEYLKQEQDTVKHVYDLVGKYVSVIDNLIYLTGPEWDPDAFTGTERENVIRTIEAFNSEYNDRNREWRSEREKLELLIGYYHPGSDVVPAWRDLRESIKNYTDCAKDRVRNHPRVSLQEMESACKDRKDYLKEKIIKLTGALEAARQYAWEGWEAPEKLRDALEKKSKPADSNSNARTPPSMKPE